MKDIRRLTKSERQKYWSDNISQYHASGLSQKEFCRRHNISYWSFNTWKRRLENKVEKNQLQEVPSEVVKKLPSQKNNFEIQFNETIRISVPDNFSEETLKRILQVVGAQI